MPIFVFKCKSCGETFEALSKFDEKGKYPSVVCSFCGSKEKTQATHLPAKPVNKNTHDYRYHAAQPAIRKQREETEKMNKIKGNPYKEIDDISSGKYFGEVK